jgi:hypothetical protein
MAHDTRSLAVMPIAESLPSQRCVSNLDRRIRTDLLSEVLRGRRARGRHSERAPMLDDRRFQAMESEKGIESFRNLCPLARERSTR